MANTTNYNLKKIDRLPDTASRYAQDDEIINTTNVGFDDIDIALQGLETNKLTKTADAKDTTVSFTESETRTNLESGNQMSVLFGKVKKFFTDLKTVAFSGLAKDVAITDTNNKFTSTNVDGALDEVGLSLEQITDKTTNIEAYIGYTSNDIYGIEIDIPNNKLTRLAGAVGKTYGANFDNIKAFKRRRCNVADDGTVLAYFGDVGYKEDGTNGQVMVEQPKFYYKRVPLVLEPIVGGIGYHLRKWRDYISDYPKAGFKLHPNFFRGGVEYENIYYPAYEGSIYDVSAAAYLLNDEQVADFTKTTGDKLCSIAGVKPASGLTQNLTLPNTRILANNRGILWQQLDILADYAEVMLMLIEYAGDVQVLIGQGVTTLVDDNTTNMAVVTGGTSSLGNASGMATGVNGKVSVSYRGRENPWGNIWKWSDGLNIEAKGIYQAYWADSNFTSDIKTAPYKNCGFTLAKINGYINAIGHSVDCDFMFIPSETLGASNRPLYDYFYQNNTYNGFLVALLGGAWHYGSYAGACCLAATTSSGFRGRDIGGGLLCLGKKTT